MGGFFSFENDLWDILPSFEGVMSRYQKNAIDSFNRRAKEQMNHQNLI